MPDLTSALFADRLQAVLALRKLTYAQCATRAGLSASHVGHYAIGTRLPSAQNIVKLAMALDVSADFLLGIEMPCQHNGVPPPRMAVLLELATSMSTTHLDLLMGIAGLLVMPLGDLEQTVER